MVLIDMPIPDTCGDCPIRAYTEITDTYGEYTCEYEAYCPIIGESVGWGDPNEYEPYFEGRHEECPLINLKKIVIKYGKWTVMELEDTSSRKEKEEKDHE